MTDIPSGKNVHVPQADGDLGSTGSASPPAEPAAVEAETHQYRASLTWSGAAAGCGEALVAKETFAIPIGGAKELAGCGNGANSEELLLAAVGTCWIATWAIFLKKLGVLYPDPRIVMTGAIGKDPAGGWRMIWIRISARVPEAILAEQRPLIEKTVALAEKYCIISKVAKAAMPVEVEIEGIGG